MSAMMSLAKQRAAMVVGDFDFTNNGAPLTALPAILTALNATYTRNSVKNVVQNGALVSLSANQFGTSYDPVAATYGYVPEPAATNLATNSGGNASTYSVSNVANGTAVTGFANGLAFGDNSVQRIAYKYLSLTIGTTYTISIFVQMDDGNAPVVGTTGSSGDFSLVTDGGLHVSSARVRSIGGGVYRVSSSRPCINGGSQSCGVVKYTGQSVRTFRITGIQVETGQRATSYIATTGSTASRSADVLTVPLWINNAKDSQDGSTANWTRGNSTVVTSGTAPDGTATAQLCTATASGVVTLYSNSTKAPAATVTYSIYVKQGNKSTCPLILRNSTTSTNFTQGILTFATGTITGAGWSATDAGNGWFRCVYTQSTGISVGDALYAFVGFAGSGADVLSDNVYFWGAQIEPGSVATTYRPTTSTLESAANANITGFSSAGYTLFADCRMDVSTAGLTDGASFSVIKDANNANYINRDSSGRHSPYNLIGGAVVAYSNADSASVARKKSAGVFQSANVDGAINGAALTLSPDAPQLLSSPTAITIGCRDAFAQLNGYIFRAQLIPIALTQEQINGLTQ